MTYIVSPYESDAQIAFLLSKGYADFAMTEDSDLLAYGCKKVRSTDVFLSFLLLYLYIYLKKYIAFFWKKAKIKISCNE